jgi:3-hydroxyisobutyrate dehydrogenase-like beta-hydroxyacid dehydrogenase
MVTKTIGFIGCGHMGSAMARRLIDGGFDVLVHDIDPAKVTALAAYGARPTQSVRAVAREASVILASLPSQDASCAVAAEIAEGGAVEVYIETSTIGLRTIQAIEAMLQPRGIAMLDMPVTGGPNWAREGRLTGILAGAAAARETAAPVLKCITGRLIGVGDRAGQGQTAKVVNNMLSLSGMMIACEAIVAGVKAGIDAETLIEVINAGTGRNSATVDKFPKAILPRTFNFGGPLGLGNKDIALFLQLTDANDRSDSIGHSVAALWQRITNDVGESADLSEMVKFFEKRAGVEVRSRTAVATAPDQT